MQQPLPCRDLCCAESRFPILLFLIAMLAPITLSSRVVGWIWAIALVESAYGFQNIFSDDIGG
jgi:hypothetical protein